MLQGVLIFRIAFHHGVTMTKSEFISCLAKQRNISIILAEQVVQTVFDSMSEALVSGDRIELRGFGSFCIKEYDGHTGRNPKTVILLT